MRQEGGKRTGGSVWAGWGVRTSGRCLESIFYWFISSFRSFTSSLTSRRRVGTRRSWRCLDNKAPCDVAADFDRVIVRIQAMLSWRKSAGRFEIWSLPADSYIASPCDKKAELVCAQISKTRHCALQAGSGKLNPLQSQPNAADSIYTSKVWTPDQWFANYPIQSLPKMSGRIIWRKAKY